MAKWFISNENKFSEAHREMIETLKKESEKRRVDISDILEKLDNENKVEEVYRLIAEAIKRFV